jgi:hypothetical protein
MDRCFPLNQLRADRSFWGFDRREASGELYNGRITVAEFTAPKKLQWAVQAIRLRGRVTEPLDGGNQIGGIGNAVERVIGKSGWRRRMARDIQRPIGHFPLTEEAQTTPMIHRGLRMATIRRKFVAFGGERDILANSTSVLEAEAEVVCTVWMTVCG